MNILMVYPEFPDTFWSFKHALNFIRKKAANPPLGLITVAAMLPGEWNKRLIDLNVEKLRQKDIEWADYVFISAMVVQRKSAKEVINRCKKMNKKTVAGGPLFTSEFDQFTDVDHLVLNEAEITLPQFLTDLENNCPKHLYSTSEYADLHQTPVPMYELIKLKLYDSMAIQYTRGCPFNCDFCSVTAMLGHRVRTKSPQQITNELDKLYNLGWRRNIFFVDDNFIGKKNLAKKEILPALIEWRKGKTAGGFITEASINLADDDELMDLMVKAGFYSVFIGIETPDEESLAECQKAQNKNRNMIDSVKKLQRAGIQVMAGFIVGFDSDTPSIFQRQIEFIQKSGIITAMVGLLQAPYGTQLYHRMKSENRLLTEMSGDNVDGSTNIIPVMDMNLLKSGYQDILKKIYSPKYFYERARTFLSEYNPNISVPIQLQDILALFRSIYILGIKGRERLYYWQLFLWTLVRYPKKFPLAITLSIYGYHFRKVSELHVA